MSKRFLFVTWEGGGTMPPELAIARRLLSRGHEVAVLAEPPSEGDVRAAGCRFEGYRHAPVRRTRDESDDPFRDWEKSAFAAAATVIDEKVCGPAGAYARDVLETLERWPADVLVVDAYLLGALVGAEKAGLPTVALSADLGLRHVPGRPPGGPGLAPARGVLGRVRDELIFAAQRHLLSRGLAPLNAARAELGLDRIAHILEPLERVERHLLLTSRAFDYPTRPPTNLRYVGPQLDDPVWEGRWEPPWPDSGAPLVLVTLGSTFQNQAGIYRAVIEALNTLPLRALVTLGNVLDPGLFDPPDHVRVVASAPHAAVLPQAAATVTHCGHGSVMRALVAGVPLVCMPIGRDQNENAARVAAHGAGIRLSRKATVKRIRAALESVLSDPSYRRAAEVLAQEIARESQGDPAVREIEALAAYPPERPTKGALRQNG